MTLTRQGWAVVWGGLALLAAGRFFGIDELYLFGAIALILVLGTLGYVYLSRLDLQVDRTVHPSRVHAGSTSRVEIHVHNLRLAPTPLLRLHDQVSGTEGADMLISPIEPHGDVSTSYRLPTARRGVLRVGPLNIVVSDPFGLAQSSMEAAQPVKVTVYPRIDQIRPVPFTVGHDPLAGMRQLHTLSHSGDDFYGLRAYVMGDDLRRIHWPSTARHDELLVCQHEQPWQGRTTVVVDVSSEVHSPESLETAISAAASVATANMTRNDLVRLVTTDGRDSGFGMGRAHLEGLLEHLALVKASGTADLASTVEVLQRDKGSGGALVVVVGDLPETRATTLTNLRRRSGSITVVQVLPPEGRSSSAGQRLPGDLPVVLVTADTPFAMAWNHSLRSQPGHRAATTARPPR